MLTWAIYGMVFLGSALMIYNIYGFIHYAREIQRREDLGSEKRILYVPIVLLILFFLGYVGVGLFGKPDLLVSGILFGGSIFVYIMYRFLSRITRHLQERKRLEAELMAAEESNRTKTEFLASMSHELRTPMNVILGQDSLALQNPDLPAETRQQLEKIGLSARHMMGLIDNILDMNRIESGEMVVKAAKFSLGEALDQLSAIIGTRCEEKGLTYESVLPEDAAGCYLGDEIKLKQALLSLLDNAVKFTSAPGRVRMAVERLAPEGETDRLRFTVEDTGEGISPEFLPQLFDVFAQEDASSTSRYSGSGLGLAVTKRIVELMGGTIEAASEKNEGSVFAITLPLTRVADEERPAEEAEAISLAGRRILIVEDNPANAEIVADLLELEDAESECAENGQVALDMLAAVPDGYYDAILMDLRMPVMDGLEATHRIRSLDRAYTKNVPIIALTANAFESDVRQSLDAGMDAHLAKPADVEMLYGTLRKLIQKKGGSAQ